VVLETTKLKPSEKTNLNSRTQLSDEGETTKHHKAESPLAALAACTSPTVDELIELIVGWAQSVLGADEIIEAREQYFTVAGKVFHDDAFYETRINYFFDFFLFERAINKNQSLINSGSITPIEFFLQQCASRKITLQPEALALARQFANFKHSFYQVLKVKENSMIIRDICTQEKHVLAPQNGETFRGFERKDVFQAFIFIGEHKTYLSRGVLQHPVKAIRTIKKNLKLVLKDPQFSLKAMLSKTARQQLRFLRHKHVDPVLLYQTDPR
jgi:hypothetical protein